MNRRRFRGAAFFLALFPVLSLARIASAESLTIDDAVRTAFERNRDVIAAKMEIESAEIERIAASVYPNPVLSYTAGNVVLGTSNDQQQNVRAAPFSQLVHTIGISEVVDVWAKRSARMRTANRGVEYRRLVVEDALREIAYSVRAAFADLTREQLELDLTRTMKDRYDGTVRVSSSRFRAGEISEAELRKIELEGSKYQNAVIDAEFEIDVARTRLAQLLGLPATVPIAAGSMPETSPRAPLALPVLLKRALDERPDLRAARAGIEVSNSTLATAKREALPDLTLGVGFTHSSFEVSGDNPNSLAVTMSLPLPVFDRNQANVARARLDARRFENDVERAELAVQHEVAEAVHRVDRASRLLDVFEGGGMLDRATKALKTAESSYNAGAISLVELLEAQRTYIETRGQYLRAQHDYRLAMIEVTHVVGEKAR